MIDKRFDVLIVGAGPAGSIAATVLARAGATVALVDKASFPRDKACGDLIGPRGVRCLDELAIDVPVATRVGDMLVVGPTGNRVRLPATPGRTYPGYGIVVPRSVFDDTLRRAAVADGAEFIGGRAEQPLYRDGALDGFELASSRRVRGDVIIGADGATSRVAGAAGLLDPRRVLWGFAVRTYLDEPVDLAQILVWAPARGVAFPGYGWVFPAGDGRANVGLGIGLLDDRAAGRRATRDLDAFIAHAREVGALGDHARGVEQRPLGSWLKLGLVGTSPARGRVLLVGDAAGLVNPLQGEGIAAAMNSGRAAAEAILAGAGSAADRYRSYLARTHGQFLSTTAPLHRSLLRRPRVVATTTRVLTAPGVGRLVAGAWSVYWNDLLDGATPGPNARTAAMVAAAGRLATVGRRDRRWLRALDRSPSAEPTPRSLREARDPVSQ
jgi:menaquinone-9 beta-reductase